MLAEQIQILKLASEQAPITKYAWALVGFAAAASAIISLIGYSRLALVVMALVFLGVMLVFVLSQLIAFGSTSVVLVGIVLMWSVVVFFIVFLAFTVSAFAAGQPCNWAEFLGINSACGKPASDRVGGSPSPKLSRTITLGNEVSVFAGGPGEANPGCQNRSAQACVTPRRGGKLVLGTQQFTVIRRIGNADRAKATEIAGATELRICYEIVVTTGACEEQHLLEGYPSAIEEHVATP